MAGNEEDGFLTIEKMKLEYEERRTKREQDHREKMDDRKQNFEEKKHDDDKYFRQEQLNLLRQQNEFQETMTMAKHEHSRDMDLKRLDFDIKRHDDEDKRAQRTAEIGFELEKDRLTFEKEGFKEQMAFQREKYKSDSDFRKTYLEKQQQMTLDYQKKYFALKDAKLKQKKELKEKGFELQKQRIENEKRIGYGLTVVNGLSAVGKATTDGIAAARWNGAITQDSMKAIDSPKDSSAKDSSLTGKSTDVDTVD